VLGSVSSFLTVVLDAFAGLSQFRPLTIIAVSPTVSASCSSAQRFACGSLQIPPRDGHHLSVNVNETLTRQKFSVEGRVRNGRWKAEVKGVESLTEEEVAVKAEQCEQPGRSEDYSGGRDCIGPI
jgi:hypothetical protein